MTVITESTDAAASIATAYQIAVGDTFLGRESVNGSDWVRIQLVAGKTYSFGLVGLEPNGLGMTDPLLRLRSESGTILASNDDGGPGNFSDIGYTASVSGTYFLEVKSLAGADLGAYGLVANEGTRPSYGADLAAAVLYRPGYSWAEAPEQAVTVTWGVRRSGPALDASGNSAPFSVLSGAQIEAMKAALAEVAAVSNVTFSQQNPGGTTNEATILVGSYDSATDGAGAYAYFPGDTASTSSDGDLWINNDSISRTSLPVGSFDYFVFLHELGHAMGLDHPGDYNAAPGVSITYDNSAQFVQDSQQFTAMSYFAATATEANCPTSYCDTLMMFDIRALQKMYGVNSTARAGNDIYGFNATLGGAYDFTVNDDPLMCIWDGAGIDTLNLSGFAARQMINLNDGTFSNVGGYRGNLSIAWGAMIENAVGGQWADDIRGNEAANWLRGGGGPDLLNGGAGNDRLVGNAGADRFVFTRNSGLDRIVDFVESLDKISLARALWGGTAKTGEQILSDHAVIRNGVVVLDFGADELTLQGISSTAGLADNLLTF